MFLLSDPKIFSILLTHSKSRCNNMKCIFMFVACPVLPFLYYISHCYNFVHILVFQHINSVCHNSNTPAGRDSGNDFGRFSDIQKETTLFLVVPKRNYREQRSYNVISARNIARNNYFI